MPIYSYRCENCGHTADILQKLSDEPLKQCPSCGQQTFNKQLTAAGIGGGNSGGTPPCMTGGGGCCCCG